MVSKIKKILLLIQCIKCITPFLAFGYFVTWCLKFYNQDIFDAINSHLGFFPSLIDKIICMENELQGIEFTMGYVFVAGFLAIIALISFNLENKFSRLLKLEEDEELRKSFEIHRQQKKEKENQEEKENLDTMQEFFGLLDFKLTYYDELYKDKNDLLKLKTEYLKIIETKLKEKYSDLVTDSEEGLFIKSDDFSRFHTIVKDIVRLFNVLREVNKQKCIQMDLLLSFWAGTKESDLTQMKRVLLKINNLGYINKVILSGGVYFRYQKEPVRHFDFVSLGVSKILNALKDGEDIDVNLICIRNAK